MPVWSKYNHTKRSIITTKCTSSFTELTTEEQELILDEETTIDVALSTTDIETKQSIPDIKIELGMVAIRLFFYCLILKCISIKSLSS